MRTFRILLFATICISTVITWQIARDYDFQLRQLFSVSITLDLIGLMSAIVIWISIDVFRFDPVIYSRLALAIMSTAIMFLVELCLSEVFQLKIPMIELIIIQLGGFHWLLNYALKLEEGEVDPLRNW